MRSFVASIALVLLHLTVAAQEPNKNCLRQISGSLLSKANGHIVQLARITVYGADTSMVELHPDTSGRFSLSIGCGLYEVHVWAEDHMHWSTTIEPCGQPCHDEEITARLDPMVVIYDVFDPADTIQKRP